MRTVLVRSIMAGMLAILLAAPALADQGARPSMRAGERTTLPSRDASVTRPLAPRSGANGDGERYAARERATTAPLASFTGGSSGIYLGTGAVIVVLLVVVILLVL
jgi:hypothetical protein